MDKNRTHKQQELYRSIRTNPDNQLFINFMSLFEARLDMIKEQLVTASDNEIYILQGQARELKWTLDMLTRTPVKLQGNGGFE